MSQIKNMSDVVASLKSDKIKERQEAIEHLKIKFEQQSAIDEFHIDEDGDINPDCWFHLFSALIHSANKDIDVVGGRVKAKSNSPAAAKTRLGVVAHTIRWLVERTVQYMNAKTAKLLHGHIRPALCLGETVYEVIALDYSKTLRCILEFPPHLDWLKPEDWLAFTSLAFNAVLDDPIALIMNQRDVENTQRKREAEAHETLQRKKEEEQMKMEVEAAKLEEVVIRMDVEPRKTEDIEMRDDTDIVPPIPPPSTKPNSRKRLWSDVAPMPMLPRKTSSNEKRRHAIGPVSQDQVEFIAILRILLSAPVAPLANIDQPWGFVSQGVLQRLQRFLERYPSDSSLLRDYIFALSSVLATLSLNKVSQAEQFALDTWDGLLNIWGTKDKTLKEGLVIVLRQLFPYVTASSSSSQTETSFDYQQGVNQLWKRLSKEAESKWGFDDLSLDSLRLEISTESRPSQGVCSAKTFRAGWGFDASQALTWAVLELQADCAYKLHEFSESTLTHTNEQKPAKRSRVENPLSTLLQTNRSSRISPSYNLQILLFFIDRHWTSLHESLKAKIIDAVYKSVAQDDVLIQSWAMVNIAAIAHAEGTSGTSPTVIPCDETYVSWETIWTQIVRKASVPGICRAACHAGYALLSSTQASTKGSGSLVPAQRVLLDIESFMKDMDVQGPSYPFDSVCAFLSLCLRLASQDARLYKFHLEDTVINWLVDHWRIVTNRSQMEPHTIGDTLHLCETLCSLSKQTRFKTSIGLPSADIVDHMHEQDKTKIFRDFVLYAKLPPSAAKKPSSPVENVQPPSGEYARLTSPRPRERKISSFFNRTLEALATEWEALHLHSPRAEAARRSLDFALTAIAFESSLTLNGVTATKPVFKRAGKVVTCIVTLLESNRWSLTEKLLVARAFEQFAFPLETDSGTLRECLVRAGEYSGIKRSLLQTPSTSDSLGGEFDSNQAHVLQQMWQNSEVQNVLLPVTVSLRKILNNLVKKSSTRGFGMDIDDGFGQGRRHNLYSPPKADEATPLSELIRTCMCTVACGLSFQSPPGVPCVDRHLSDLTLESGNHSKVFLIVCPVYLQLIQRNILSMSLQYLDKLIRKVGELLKTFEMLKNEAFTRTEISILFSSIGVWAEQSQLAKDITRNSKILFSYLAVSAYKNLYYSWSTRDLFAQFLGKLLANDPAQINWPDQAEFLRRDKLMFGQPEHIDSVEPAALLRSFNGDSDIRVRCRAAVLNATQFPLANRMSRLPTEIYASIVKTYTSTYDNYEHMLSRILGLGNIVVASAAVRRGAYWHMLETFTRTDNKYTLHMESVLVGVSERLSMSSLSVLFEAYAPQIAFSVININADFLHFPPHLLGYSDRKQCAQATLRAVTPTYILSGRHEGFRKHCAHLGINIESGLVDSFGDVVGVSIVNWFYCSQPPGGLEVHLVESFRFMGKEFQPPFSDNLDGIVAAVLRKLGEQDYSPNGTMLATLHARDSEMARTFASLVQYRVFDANLASENNPSYGLKNILDSLDWISQTNWNPFLSQTTYHVLHLLMRDLHQTPLVNEQMRLLTALSVWIAYRQADFAESCIADTLIHGIASLLSNSDLITAAQSILEWIFAKYPSDCKWKESRLPNLLVRIRFSAQDYCDDGINKELGSNLVDWIDGQVTIFSKKPSFRSLVHKVLPSWPKEPTSLGRLYEETSLYDLVSTLEDYRITSNKFWLVRRLTERTSLQEPDEDQFMKIFWRLKESIPNSSRLRDDDIVALTDILLYHHGHIGSLNVEQRKDLSPRNHHRRVNKKSSADKKADAAENALIPRFAITLGLLAMLDDDQPARVFSAYTALRHTLSVAPLGISSFNGYAEYHADLQYLQFYQRPFIVRQPPNLSETLQSEVFLEMPRNFTEWVTTMSILMSDTLSSVDRFYGQLSFILASDAAFAEQILPILVHTILNAELEQRPPSQECKQCLSTYFTAILANPDADIQCIRTIVDIVLHLRFFLPPGDSSPVNPLVRNRWLEIDFSTLARSAILCGSYTTALLFVELAAEHNSPSSPNDAATENVLYEIYSHIDEPDGFYGIKTQDLQDFLVKRFHHEKQWDKAFRFHGAALEAGVSLLDEQAGLIQSFHSFGFDHLAMDTLRSSRDSSVAQSNAPMNYKLGWRTETWDLPEQSAHSPSSALYRSLRAIHRERDPKIQQQIIRSALHDELSHLRDLGSENLAEIRVVTQDLMCLGEILRWRRRDHNGDFSQLLGRLCTIGDGFDFSDMESIMATRISLLRSERQKEQRQQLGNLVTDSMKGLLETETKCLIRVSKAARVSNEVQIALNSVVRAQKLGQKLPDVQEEFANVLWAQKEEKAAVQILHSVVDRVDPIVREVEATRYAPLLARLGTWTSAACLEKPVSITDRYFKPAQNLLEDSGPANDSTRASVFRECAMYAERQYQAFQTSPDGVRLKIYVDRKYEEIEQRHREISQAHTANQKTRLQGDQAKAQKVLGQDRQLFNEHVTMRDYYLKQALDMHSRCLESSDEFDDDSAIRFCSLWFSNFEDEMMFSLISEALDRIPSRKLVFLAHQITARITAIQPPRVSTTSPTEEDTPPKPPKPNNQEHLQRLVLRMCREHPFHTLYQVYCISDHPAPETDRRSSGRHFAQSTQTERGEAANKILNRLRNEQGTNTRVRDIEFFCNASLEWAKFKITGVDKYKKKVRGKKFDIPSHLKILKIKGSGIRVAIPTMRTPLDPRMEYNDCVWIKEYNPTFDTAGGVSMPKICVCIGSDGKEYKQLFKGEGNDDLRQDAVMEQVFSLVNNLLLRDRETKRRRLNVREYKVIPISSQAGLIEFVGNTAPLREWLLKGHLVYRPNDLKPDEVQAKIKAAQQSHKERPDLQLAEYRRLKEKFHPVMRHYAMEQHKSPMTWFQMRLAYTRSVATNSIVGHVLGLGDRHVSNILLDSTTGEVVHIDLGIAFDQGKLLPVPERVPFRMTADMVDGMGISGTGGVFQRCAEETLRVLRDESGVVMTVLEVFKHDPLHSWTASEIKVRQAGGPPDKLKGIGIDIDMNSGTAEEAADRALSSVARKLDKGLSIESTVNELIAEATDAMNLATIFYGWSPHL